MRFLFLNQYSPPDPSPTARLLGELAEHLWAKGHEVEIVSQQSGYQSRPTRGARRLVRELLGLLTILQRGWRAQKPDVILALSSPPGVLVAAAVLALRHRAALTHWAMDLYPELASALGEIRSSLVIRLARAGMGWAYRRAALLVALDEDMKDHLQWHYQCAAQVLPPWLSTSAAKQVDALARKPGGTIAPATPWTWLYSGNLGRAHEWERLLAAQQILEARDLPIDLVFQGDGAVRIPAQARAKELGLRRCHWKAYSAEENLVDTFMSAGLLIVTQRPETRGLLWPSKLALLSFLPRPILWIGPEDGAIAGHLRQRGNSGVFPPNAAEPVANWIEALFRTPLQEAGRPNATESIHRGCATMEEWLCDALNRSKAPQQ